MLSRGRFILLASLRCITFILLVFFGLIIIELDEGLNEVSLTTTRRVSFYVSLAVLLLLKLLSMTVSLVHTLFNLVEYRRTSRVAFYSLRESLGLRGEPGRVWSWLKHTFFRGRGAFG